VANSIDLTGYVTFSSLSTPGQTTIDGGNIKANTITADSIKAGGTITGNKFTNGNVTIDESNITISGSSGYLKGKVGSTTNNLIGFSGWNNITIGNSSYGNAATINVWGKTINFGYSSTSGATRMYVNGDEVLTTHNIPSLGYITRLRDGRSTSFPYIELYDHYAEPTGVIHIGSAWSRFASMYTGVLDANGNVKLGAGPNNTLGFFGSSGAKKTHVAKTSSSATLSTLTAKVNDLIGALNSYGLV
jgi:hypothetical protein